MRIAYLDCATGISGDMTLAALFDAGVDVEQVRAGISSLQLPEVKLEVHEIMKGCFRAKQIQVIHPEQHAHRHFSDIVKLLNNATGLTDRQRGLAQDIFQAVAQAEARVHGTTLDKIHFHEVGAIDSIVDIVGAAIGFDLLNVDQIHCSPIPTGHGTVKIDHGLCAVPTPGTAELLKGIPLVDVPIEAELTTPTGAAIVKTLVDRFGRLPAMHIEQIGYGAGTMNFASRANLLRIFVGTTIATSMSDEVVLLETNLDDVTGEVIGYTKQALLKQGALDVYTVPIQMKKDRPGVILCVLAKWDDVEKFEETLFKETSTLGIRRQTVQRSTRARQPHTVLTEFGPVIGKLAWQSSGNVEFSPEFEACSLLAIQTGRTLKEIYRTALSVFDQQQAQQRSEVPMPASGTTAADSHSHDHAGHDHDHHTHDHDHHTHDSHSHDHDNHK